MDQVLTDDIGGRLQRARERRGLSLRDAARRTKLSINVLQAIERNDFASLPGGMFRKAYLRTLAAEVGLNPNEIAADYCARFEPPIEPLAVTNGHTALHDKWIEQLSPSPRRSIATLAALAAAAVAWFMLQPRPAGPKTPVHDPASGFVAVRMPGSGAGALTSGGSRNAATPAAIAGENREPPLRIEIRATGWCWVAAEADGDRVLYRLVEPGERLLLEAQRLISLRLGDAGSVMLSINDGASRSFGRHGEIIELELTPGNVEGLRDGAVGTVSED